jgi:DNA-binding FadR family transcriptional regulator
MPPLKRDVVAALLRGMVADGTLKPGAFAPYATALAAQTGYGANTCASALESLVRDGTLTRGPRGDNRPRVAGAALSARLKALRADEFGVTRPTIYRALAK